ncbi:unnamed protein product [Mytilus coruscus]|uniref:Uncharacterized protein n=1 Tax=Mytilus coruscus TaxID=42192 RepID=A0A6J8AJ28_MYTCO|nr:unnamed protein product [Mytilus coruscus]
MLGAPLYLAIAFGHTDIVRLLIKQNCDIDLHEWFTITPLYVATVCNHIEIVEILLEHGCDINMRNDENESLLHVASKLGYVDIVKLLLNNNCDINICNKKRESPLHAASKCMGCVLGVVDKVFKHDGFNFELLLLLHQRKTKVSYDDYVEVVKLLLMRNA